MTYEEVKSLFAKYPVASTWNSTNPQALYFDTGQKGNWRSRGLDAPNGGERYIKTPFAEVAPHIEKTGRYNSENIFYRLRQTAPGDSVTLTATALPNITRVDIEERSFGTARPVQIAIDDNFIGEWHPKYDRIAYDEPEYQRLVREVAQNIKSTGTISKETFLDIWRWKGAIRSIRWVELDRYDTLYAEAFRRAALEPPGRKLSALIGMSSKLPGVEAATGSTLIHFMHPETMPIIDIRTISVLFEAGLISSHAKDLNHYVEFRGAIAGIRSRCPNWSLRQIDRALFAYDTIVLEKNTQYAGCASG